MKKLSRQKPILFITPFGKFYCRTPGQWFVMNPDFEVDAQDIIRMVGAEKRNQTEKQDKIFIDIGAHIGRHAIPASLHHGFMTYAFEPSKETYEILIKNIKTNNLTKKIKTYNLCLGNNNGSIKYNIDPINDTNSNIRMANLKLYGKSEKSLIRRYDDVATVPKKADLVLIDVDGFEYEVVLGMRNLFHNSKRIKVVIEITQNKKKIFDFFKNENYKIKHLDLANYLFYK